MTKQTQAFVDGFVPVETPFIRCPTMKPFRIRAFHVKETDTLMVIREQKWAYFNGDAETEYEKEFEFSPATDGKQQLAFIEELRAQLGYYYGQLAICCMRRGSGMGDEDIGFYVEPTNPAKMITADDEGTLMGKIIHFTPIGVPMNTAFPRFIGAEDRNFYLLPHSKVGYAETTKGQRGRVFAYNFDPANESHVRAALQEWQEMTNPIKSDKTEFANWLSTYTGKVNAYLAVKQLKDA